MQYASYRELISHALKNLEVTESKRGALQKVDAEAGFSAWCELTRQLKAKNKTMYFIGNGASAMMASHMAADASKCGGFRSLAFNDAAFLTAISNDISYEQVFSMPLKRFANPGDVLVTVSSSGNSPNVLAGIQAAKEIGLFVVTLSGMNAENKSRQRGDLNFYVPANTYGLVEVSHQMLLHFWLDQFAASEQSKK